jgi:hypothetical protein
MKNFSIKNILISIINFLYLTSLPIIVIIGTEYLRSNERVRKIESGIMGDVALFAIWFFFTIAVFAVNRSQYKKDKSFAWAMIAPVILFVILGLIDLGLIFLIGGLIISGFSSIF